MELILCGFCDERISLKELKSNNGNILIYSRHVNEYFCDISCMDNYYSEYMGTTHINIKDATSLNDAGIKLKKDKFFQVSERMSK